MIKNFHWGKGIALGLGIFLLMNAVAVIFIIQQDNDLVESDYYEKGLAYETQIQKEKNLVGTMQLAVSNSVLQIKFPDEQKGTTPTGKIWFKHSQFASKDFSLNLSVDSSGIQLINTEKIEKGAWNIRIDWSAAGKEYSYRQKLFL